MVSLYAVYTVILMVTGTLAKDPMYKKPEVTSLHIHSDITYRYATTKVTSRIKNHGERPREALFQVTLPNEAFITNLTIEIDGNITVGEIKEKEVAKAQYVAAQQRGESAGYIGTKHRETNKFELAITVAPLKKISFNLTYQELLKRKLGYYEQEIFIDPGTTVKDLDVTVNIEENRDISKLSVPPLRNDVGDEVTGVDNIVVISQPTNNTATIKYAPSVDQQKLQSDNGIAGRFVVQYDVERGLDFGDVLMVNGYFVHFFAPEGLQPMPNDVLFILDVSGSMQGKKMSQLKKAMMSNLDQLSPDDRFNIMTFSSKIIFWRQSMMNVDDEDALEDAKTFIRKLDASGWTDIDGALTRGLSFLVDQLTQEDSLRSSIIVFLTDGEPTRGEDDPAKILQNVQQLNEGEIPIFTLAFGSRADWDFVKKLALQNNGFGRKIYEASDAAMQIMGFYNEISVTLLSNITFNYLDVEASKVTQSHFSNYFNGSEVVVCGFVSQRTEEMNVEVSYKSASGPSSNNIIISGDFSKDFFGDVENVTDGKDYEQITEKVWAYLTIKQLLQEMEATGEGDKATEIKKEILKLSLKYGFVTPLTSMVVTQQKDNVTTEQPVNVQPVGDNKPTRGRRPQFTSSQAIPVVMSRGVSRLSADPIFPYHRSDPSLHAYPPRAMFPMMPKRRGPKRGMPNIGSVGPGRPNIGSVGPGRPNNPKRYKQKKNKKGRRKERRFPLLVKYPTLIHSMCFTLYEPNLKNGEATYLLYASKTKDVKFYGLIFPSSNGRKNKRGAIREIKIQAPNHNIEFLSRYTISDVTKLTPTSSLTVRRQSGSMNVTFDVDGLVINAYFAELHNEFYISVQQNVADASPHGVIGQVLQHRAVMKLQRKNKKAVKLGRATYSTMLRNIPDEMGFDSCLNIRKFESRIYDMAQVRI